MIAEEQLNKVDQFLASAKLTDDYILEFKIMYYVILK